MKRTGKKKRSSEIGMSLIELMFAGFVLTVGMLGSLVMVLVAIQSNTRNKFDSTGTMVAQLVMEHINTMPTNQVDPATAALVTQINITDCQRPDNNPPTTWPLGVTGGDPAFGGNGAQLNAAGDIDWTQPGGNVPAGYRMLYYSCGDIVWEARWNIQQLSSLTKLITVSSRQAGTAGAQPRTAWVFAPPVTLRTVSGP
jgi:hypothetical protein